MLQEASIEMTALAMADGRESEADAKLLVIFSRRAHQNRTKSLEEGRPIYDEVDFVTIMVPGDKDSVIDRPARDTDIRRFHRQYAAYQARTSQEAASGTPLRHAGFLGDAQIKELEFFNVYSVEQLAAVSDGHAGKFMGLQALKQKANAYLAAAKDLAPVLQLQAALEERDGQLAAANEALAELAARVKALESKKG